MSALVLTTGRVSELVRALAGALRPLGNTQGNQLVPLTDEDYGPEDHHLDLLLRQTHRSGMLLNSDEVVALAHLPTAAVRAKMRTPTCGNAPAAATAPPRRRSGKSWRRCGSSCPNERRPTRLPSWPRSKRKSARSGMRRPRRRRSVRGLGPPRNPSNRERPYPGRRQRPRRSHRDRLCLRCHRPPAPDRGSATSPHPPRPGSLLPFPDRPPTPDPYCRHRPGGQEIRGPGSERKGATGTGRHHPGRAGRGRPAPTRRDRRTEGEGEGGETHGDLIDHFPPRDRG